MTAAVKPVPTPVVRTSNLLDALRVRYAQPEWHCEEEVTLGGRRLDVVALNMWGARRYTVVGFELKVSRGDWMRELTAFQKAEQWVQVCDSFYVVTPPKIIRTDELPSGWGHLELCGSRLFTRRIAIPVDPPRTTLPREVAARFITRLINDRAQFERHLTGRLRAEIAEEARRNASQQVDRERETLDVEVVRKADQFDKLIAALGLSASWHPEDRVLRAVRMLAALNFDRSLPARLSNMVDAVGRDLTALREAVQTLEEIPA